MVNKPGLRVGIFAGAFDPVHAGHVAFALQAMTFANLDEVVFVPERRPRHKPGVEHYAHRVAMLKQAIRPHRQFSVMELVDRHITVTRTLPQLHAIFKNCQLVLLTGSDVAPHIASWPYAKRLLTDMELVVGMRQGDDQTVLLETIAGWPAQPRDLLVMESYAPAISSRHIRVALRTDKPVRGLLASVKQYAEREWLYVSPGLMARTRGGHASDRP
ncbi:MAG TPA: nicotinate-nicotinamide nucleotide adenylyltransferase [Hymenobacter sp.]